MCIVLACWIYRMRGVLVHERPMGHMAPRVSVSSVVTYTRHSSQHEVRAAAGRRARAETTERRARYFTKKTAARTL